jgi:hypothetical protein
MRSILSLLLLAALSPALAAPRATPVAIRAYVNVSSGCQIATLDLLDSLKAKYAPSVSSKSSTSATRAGASSAGNSRATAA